MSDQSHSSDLERIVRASAEEMPLDVRERVRERVVSQSRGLAVVPARLHVAFLRATTVFVALGLATSTVAYGAAYSLPGDPLYGFKRAVEEARVALSFQEEGRDEQLLGITRTRAFELKRLMESNAPTTSVDAAAVSFGEAARRALEGEGKPVEEKSRTINETVDEQPVLVRERAREQLPKTSSQPPAGSGTPQTDAPQQPPIPGDEGGGSGAGSDQAPGASGSEQPGSGESPGGQ